jgi:hypothetical protein
MLSKSDIVGCFSGCLLDLAAASLVLLYLLPVADGASSTTADRLVESSLLPPVSSSTWGDVRLDLSTALRVPPPLLRFVVIQYPG